MGIHCLCFQSTKEWISQTPLVIDFPELGLGLINKTKAENSGSTLSMFKQLLDNQNFQCTIKGIVNYF